MIITFANHKGGVGKTTSATNTAVGIAMHTRKPTLLIDTDSSGNATLLTTGRTAFPPEQSLFAVVMATRQDAPEVLKRCIVASHWQDNLHVLPATARLQEAQRLLGGTPGAPFRLSNAISSVRAHYAAIVFDTQPSFSLLTEMALLASDVVYVPVEPRYLETAGLQQIIHGINDIREGWQHHDLHVGGLLITKMDARIRGHRAMVEHLRKHEQLGSLVTDVIPVNEAVTYSHHNHTSIFQYDRRCGASRAYARFVNHVLQAELEA